MQQPEESLTGASSSTSNLMSEYGKYHCRVSEDRTLRDSPLSQKQLHALRRSIRGQRSGRRLDCYPVEEVVPPHCSHMVAVIQHSEVALRRPVKLPDLDVSEPADKLPPDLGSDPVANGHPHLVDVVIGFLLWEENGRRVKPIMLSFSL